MKLLSKQGIVQVPEGRKIFATLTVMENLEMGAFTRQNKTEIEKDMQSVFSALSSPGGAQSQLGGTLSGGEQQMLAIARGLMADPQLDAPRRAIHGSFALAGRTNFHDHP